MRRQRREGFLDEALMFATGWIANGTSQASTPKYHTRHAVTSELM
jgi:hypothetical protein